MIEFLEKFTAAVSEHPDRPAIVDRDGTRTTLCASPGLISPFTTADAR
ncbi:MAG: hypothetical protein IJG65_00780 [Synergistaceae bacterium]|nr:hypothetical protein [Synergistaceae bacterium]